MKEVPDKRAGNISELLLEMTTRKAAIAERDLLLSRLEERFGQRTAELQKEITERKQAEKLLLDREAKLQSIINSAPVGIGVAVNRIFTEVNSRFCELLGYPANELLGRNARMVYPSDEEYEHAGKMKYEMIESKGIGTLETKLCSKSGKLIDVLMSSMPIDPQHLDKGITFTILDISERKLLEDVLKKANYELEKKDLIRSAELIQRNKELLTEIEERKRSENKLLSARKNLRAMALEVLLAEERSRQHFATDLHDSVVQTLAAAKLRTQLIQNEIPQRARPVFAELQELLSEGISQARSIMSELSPPVLNELGLIHALEWISEETQRKHGLAIGYESRLKEVSLTREIEVLLFQTTRELLANIVKHARARSATVKFYRNGRNLCIEVADTGRGFDMKKTLHPDSKGGFGLYGIRERLRHIGGQLLIRSVPGRGTTVLVMTPQDI